MREDREALERIKTIVFQLEKENFEYIFVYYSGKNWYKIGGNSVLFFVNEVIPKSNGLLKGNLRADSDYHNKFPDGVISIGNLEKLREKFQALGIFEEKEKSVGTEIIAFKLTKKVSPEKLKKFRGQYIVEKEKLNETLSLYNFDPEFAKIIQELSKETFELVHSMQSLDRILTGNNLFDEVRNLHNTYYVWAKGNSDESEKLDEIEKYLDLITSDILFMIEGGILTAEQVKNFTSKIEALRKIIRIHQKQKKLFRIKIDNDKNVSDGAFLLNRL